MRDSGPHKRMLFSFFQLGIMALFFSLSSKVTQSRPRLVPRSGSPWAACWTTSTGTPCSSSAWAHRSTSQWTSTGGVSAPRASSVPCISIMRCDGYVSINADFVKSRWCGLGRQYTLEDPPPESVKVLRKCSSR